LKCAAGDSFIICSQQLGIGISDQRGPWIRGLSGKRRHVKIAKRPIQSPSLADQGGAVNQKEEEESKCREFVAELNRLAAHERYRYVGRVSELEAKEFSDCLIMDRRTSKELHVECTRYSPDWMSVERSNMQMLEKRFAYDLANIGYENNTIFLRTRNWHSHPLQKLNRSGVEELARSIKQFLVDHKKKGADQSSAQFNLDDFPRYAPLAGMFQFLRLTKVENPQPLSPYMMAHQS